MGKVGLLFNKQNTYKLWSLNAIQIKIDQKGQHNTKFKYFLQYETNSNKQRKQIDIKIYDTRFGIGKISMTSIQEISQNAYKQYIENIIFQYSNYTLEKKMLHQFAMITDFDQYENDYLENKRFSLPVFHKDDFLKQTQDNELEVNQIGSITRSLKYKTCSSQTSFGNTIMEQHNLAFKKNLQKYMENCYPSLKKVQEKSLASQIYEIDAQHSFGEQKLKEFVMKDNKLFEQKEKKIFLTDLFYEEKLNEFLTTVCNLTPSPLALELIFIGNLIWQAFVPKQQEGLSQGQIRKFVEDLLETENLTKYVSKFSYLNFEKASINPEIGQRERNQNLKSFLTKFGVTILLVIEQYFQNPYSKEEQGFSNMKRSLNFKDISNDEFSDDEEEISFSLGHKKRNI